MAKHLVRGSYQKCLFKSVIAFGIKVYGIRTESDWIGYIRTGIPGMIVIIELSARFSSGISDSSAGRGDDGNRVSRTESEEYSLSRRQNEQQTRPRRRTTLFFVIVEHTRARLFG